MLESFDQLYRSLPGGPAVPVVLGAVMLLFGRRLLWLAVAAVGFVGGAMLALEFLGPESMGEGAQWIVLGIGLAAGLIGAAMAVALKKLAVAVGGFVAGGVAATWAAETFAVAGQLHPNLVFVAGGVLAAILSLSILDWALVVITAVAGGVLILRPFELQPAMAGLALIVLTVVGISAQKRSSRR